MSYVTPRLRIPNLVLPLLRERLGYSQQNLADRLTEEAVKRGDRQTICDVRMVRRWENGDVVWPQEKYRILLERVFGKTSLGLGFVRRWTRTPSGWTLVSTAADKAEVDADGISGSKKMSLDSLPGFDEDSLGESEEFWLLAEAEFLSSSERPRRIGMEHVERVERLVGRINSLDHDRGGGELLLQALNGVKVTRILLKKSEYSEKVGKRLEVTTGEMLIQAGWLAYDSGLQRLARTLYTEAFLLGKVSGHGEITAHSLSNMSIQANALGDPRDAVKFARTAQSHAGSWATPRVRSVFALHEARGLASLKEGSACESALAISTDYFDGAGSRDDDPRWIGYLNEEELATLTGVCLMDLGKFAEACDFLEKGAGSFKYFVRNRSSSATFYMRDLLLWHEIEQACTIGKIVLPSVLSLSSARIINQFQRFCGDLRGHVCSPVVSDFLGDVEAQMSSKKS